MSCGDPHEVDCSEILANVDAFIDNELADGHDLERIGLHLAECAPCMRAVDFERAMKALVARACGSDRATEELRSKVITRIHALRVEIHEA